MRIEVTARDVAKIALDAYEAGRLAAQADVLGTYYLKRDGFIFRCAIGQCFTEAEAFQLEHTKPYRLIDEGIIVTDDRFEVSRIQTLHDNWAEDQTQVSEQRFVDYCKELLDANG